MAIDEAVLKARIADLVPNTLRLYRWKPSAVSIGRFQDIENEVQLDNCRKQGVDIVRRITGGGTVYHDAEDEVTYSVIARKEDFGTEDIAAVYARIYAGLAEAVKTLGLHADFNQGNAKVCPNLTVDGKKISGSAQAHKSGVVLQHGTLLLKVNLERMFTYLRVPWAQTRMQVVSIARNKITSIEAELGKNVSTEEVSNALVRGFENALNIKLTGSKLTAGETELSRNLCKEKYATDDWNFRGKSVSQK
jgi:lipoate-protein ligase A